MKVGEKPPAEIKAEEGPAALQAITALRSLVPAIAAAGLRKPLTNS